MITPSSDEQVGGYVCLCVCVCGVCVNIHVYIFCVRNSIYMYIFATHLASLSSLDMLFSPYVLPIGATL